MASTHFVEGRLEAFNVDGVDVHDWPKNIKDLTYYEQRGAVFLEKYLKKQSNDAVKMLPRDFTSDFEGLTAKLDAEIDDLMKKEGSFESLEFISKQFDETDNWWRFNFVATMTGGYVSTHVKYKFNPYGASIANFAFSVKSKTD